LGYIQMASGSSRYFDILLYVTLGFSVAEGLRATSNIVIRLERHLK
jgi:hypothetical protein